MERKISDKHVEIIKIMISKGYSYASIKDELLIKHGQKINTMQLQAIKRGESYNDIREDLNESIFAKCQVNNSTDTKHISEIKWAIANDYSETEILKVFQVSKKRLLEIKMLYAPYINISPEYNGAIRSLHPRKKKANIDKKMVIEIKKQFVMSNGNVNFVDIGNSFKVTNATVSNIINLKSYSDYGISLNSKIISIKNKMIKEKKIKEASRIRRKTYRSKINELQKEKRRISELIKKKRKEFIEIV